MTQNRRKRGFNDGTEDRSVAPYFQWKLKYGAIASSPQAPYPLLPREARKQAHSAAAPLQIKAFALIWLFLCAARSTEKQQGCFPVENSRSIALALLGWSARGLARRFALGCFCRGKPTAKTDLISFASQTLRGFFLAFPSGGRGTALARWMRAVFLRSQMCFAHARPCGLCGSVI